VSDPILFPACHQKNLSPAFLPDDHGSSQPGQVWILLPPVFDVWSAVIDPGDNKNSTKAF
jgi:hypothetical protein